MKNLVDEFYRFFHEMPRQGPGSRETTLAALDVIRPYLPKRPQILEIGCGSGGSTLDLASFCQGHVTALDNDEKALNILKQRAKSSGLAQSITTRPGCMTQLDFKSGTFDLIWSEASAYSMGFNRALHTWRPYLRRNGLLIISELGWTVDDPPEEARKFWEREYPSMKSVSENMSAIYRAGYAVISHFMLDDNDWETNYYTPMEHLIAQRRHDFPDCECIGVLCQQLEKEIRIYRKYSFAFDYVFAICRKNLVA